MPRKPAKTASLMLEHTYRTQGYRCIVGFDEVGRGAWAGPVTAGAVCLPLERDDLMEVLLGVRDSKTMTRRQRARTAELIKQVAVAWGVGDATSQEIDELGIVPATRLAMKRALQAAQIEPDFLLLDSMPWPEMQHVKSFSTPKADTLSLTVAAASVLAKEWRDQHMREQDQRYPVYGFASHVGYGTAQHSAALKLYGPTPIHRFRFKPIYDLTHYLQ